MVRLLSGVEVVVREAKARGRDALVRFAGRVEPVDVEVRQYLNAAGAWQLVRREPKAAVTISSSSPMRSPRMHGRSSSATGSASSTAPATPIWNFPGSLSTSRRRRPLEALLPRAGRLSGNAGVVAQALLLERDHTWRVRDLAERAGVSDGLAHRVLARLEGDAPHRRQRRVESNSNPEPRLIQNGDNNRIWVLPWSRVLDWQRRHLQFMRDRLEHSSTEEDAVNYLRKTHADRLPTG